MKLDLQSPKHHGRSFQQIFRPDLRPTIRRVETTVQVNLDQVTKTYDNVKAVDQVSLTVSDSELFCLLGPSGCGKTTTLRLIAGLETPDSGTIRFDGKDVTRLPPYDRDIGVVFQDYALFPHMNVFENVAYGLNAMRFRREGLDALLDWSQPATIKEKVHRSLKAMKIEALEHRRPDQLSGGQQQRVSLARALVLEPKVLLLDEPLSNLDAKLRVEMRTEIRRIQKELGLTAIYVTHDQEEAMTISDRIALMHNGRLIQVGSPKEIYENPDSVLVADFIGRTNIMYGMVTRSNQKSQVQVGSDITLLSSENWPKQGEEVAAIIRPEAIKMVEGGPTENTLSGVVTVVTYLGSVIRYRIDVKGNELVVDSEASSYGKFREKDPVTLSVSEHDVKLLKRN